MQWNLAPIDLPLLGLIQLIQPAHPERVYLESRDTIVAKYLNRAALVRRIQRLEETGYLLRSDTGLLLVAPKSYALLGRSLDPKERDKARLISLNRQRYE
jgi:hypothetical protein